MKENALCLLLQMNVSLPSVLFLYRKQQVAPAGNPNVYHLLYKEHHSSSF